MHAPRTLGLLFTCFSVCACVVTLPEDTGSGYLWRLNLEQDATIQESSDIVAQFEYHQYLYTGVKSAAEGKRRALLQFHDLPTECGRIEWAKMYLHYYNAHKDEWMSAAAVPEKIQEVEVYQVHKPWIFNLATSVKRTYYENWSMRMLSLDGNDAGPDVIDTVKIHPGQPPSFVKFDVTCALVDRRGDGVNNGFILKVKDETTLKRELRWYSDRHNNTASRAYINVLCDDPRSQRSEAQTRAQCNARWWGHTGTQAPTTLPPHPAAPTGSYIDIYTGVFVDIPLQQMFPNGAPQSCDELLAGCPTTYPSTRKMLPHPTNAARYCVCRYCDHAGVTIEDAPCRGGTVFNFNLQDCTRPNTGRCG